MNVTCIVINPSKAPHSDLFIILRSHLGGVLLHGAASYTSPFPSEVSVGGGV